MITIKAEWFLESPRKLADRALKAEIIQIQQTQTDFGLYNQEDNDALYGMSVQAGLLSVAMLCRYLIVDIKHTRPWVGFDQVKHVVDIQEFEEYIDTVRTRLNQQPPTKNYGSLVFLQTISSQLNSMEITHAT